MLERLKSATSLRHWILQAKVECLVVFNEGLSPQNSPPDPKYLFDWSLPLHCPELMADLKIPDYFADNIFLRTPESSLYHNSWPSLFIAPAGITSELHVDAFASNFWMALFEGKKRYSENLAAISITLSTGWVPKMVSRWIPIQLTVLSDHL